MGSVRGSLLRRISRAYIYVYIYIKILWRDRKRNHPSFLTFYFTIFTDLLICYNHM